MKKNIPVTPRTFKKIDSVILLVILVVAFVFRLYKINTPLADLHSWRQSDTSAVTRNFVKNGIDMFHPKYDDLSSNQTGYENPEGYRFVEFPIYNAIVAGIYRFFPLFSIEEYGRGVTAIFSLFIIGVIYYLALKENNRLTAIIASSVYAVFPFFVFFSRVILPETTSLSLALLAIFFLYLYSESKKNTFKTSTYILSLLAFTSSLLVKPPAIFYAIALFIIFFKKYGVSLVKKPPVYAYFMIGVLPLILWRMYIQNYPEGIPPNDWLITSVNTYEGLKNIFFKPAFFRWIFFERINNYMLGGYLSFFLLLGILAKPKKYVLLSLMASALTYLFIFQGGNVQHEYYQTYLLPAVAIFIGIGVSFLMENKQVFINPLITSGIAIIIFGLSYFFSYYKVRDFYIYPAELPQIGNIIKTLTKEDDRIVTDRMGDTTLLYLTGRKGAPSIYKNPPELKQLGYNYLVTLNESEINKLKEEKYQVVFENDKFTLFKL